MRFPSFVARLLTIILFTTQCAAGPVSTAPSPNPGNERFTSSALPSEMPLPSGQSAEATVAGASTAVHIAESSTVSAIPQVSSPAITSPNTDVSSAANYAKQPVAIFHAFDQRYSDVTSFVCTLAKQGYSHIQIAPVQRSNPSREWWARYQPVDYSIVEGRGSEQELKALIAKAHACNVKVIVDVVFNHMANMEEYKGLDFPGLTPQDFHPPCDINYSDGNRDTEINCWLGSLPDLDQTSSRVQRLQQAHIQTLLDLGIDGFRLDAAKHMTASSIQQVYVDYINTSSQGTTWNYLEVISDSDTQATDYTGVAAVTDFVLYSTMKDAFSFGGDLRSLRVPHAVNDPHSITFGRNHDTIREINPNAINPYVNVEDSYFATAYVLARQRGTPLVLNWDNADVDFIRAGVTFRQIMYQRELAGQNVVEHVLATIDSPTVLLMERGSEGFFMVNKGVDRFDVPVLDLTLTNLEGCYRELRTNLKVAVERRSNGQKFVTRWETWARSGMNIAGRDALYFIREPWDQCVGN